MARYTFVLDCIYTPYTYKFEMDNPTFEGLMSVLNEKVGNNHYLIHPACPGGIRRLDTEKEEINSNFFDKFVKHDRVTLFFNAQEMYSEEIDCFE